MPIQTNIPLKNLNSFLIDAKAKAFASFTDVESLASILDTNKESKILLLGSGSNILFRSDFDGLVLKNEIKGISIVKEDERHVYVKAGAGENWHSFVLYCLQRNWAGLENLSLIPGTVGAAPIQNIGAYGVELKESFFELEAYSFKKKKVFAFSVNDCQFGYRDSVFKTKWKGEYVIVNVTFRFDKIAKLHTAYGAIGTELKEMGITNPNIRDISNAVIRIRTSKLPDPAQIGNAGSFFKNPAVPSARYETLKKEYPAIVGYPNTDGKVKLAAGWLIEACGWKGYRKADAGVHDRQALVLVNYGQASGQEIYDLSEQILESVKGKFGITLEREVNII